MIGELHILANNDMW